MNKRQKLVQRQFLNNEEAVIKRLKQVYGQSLKDINSKAQELQNQINGLQAALNAAEDDATKATLKSMVQSKVYQKQYQDALKKQIGSILDNMQVEEFKTISEYLQKCYEDGFIGTMFDLQGQGIPLCFPLDQEAMVRAVQLDSKISHGLYSRLGEDVAMLKKKITAQVSRGISTGMTFQQVAQQLAGYTKIGYNNAIRIARTEGHRVQVQSAMEACYKAQEVGADIVKQWDAALDKRTRPSHARVDGEIREVDEPFSNGLMFPGDPAGRAGEVINCRCALLQRARWALDDDELETLKKRAEFYGLDKTANFDEFKQKYLKAAQKMASETEDNDWTKAIAKPASKEEKHEVIKYAADNGVEIGDIDSFDGDINLLKAEIVTVSKACKEYGIKNTVTVSSRVLEDDSDFAITKGYEIIFNSKALRDRKITEYNITNTKRFASRTVEDIALHEVGHIISNEKAVNSLELCKKAYYNMAEKYVSRKMLKQYLLKEVSMYASSAETEIVSEVIVRNKNHPTEFTKAFVSLLMGGAT